jgi:hypothetical protein
VTWMVRAARLGSTAALSLVIGVVAGLLRGEQAPVPSLTQGSAAPVPVVAVLALLPVGAGLWSWSQLPRPALAVSVRTSRWHLVCLLVAPAAFALASGVAGGTGALMENARNTFGLLGLGLVGMRLLGERGGVLVPAGYLLAAFLIGRPAGGAGPAVWAWVLHDGGDATALVLASALAATGLAMSEGLPRSSIRRGETLT